MIHHSDRGLKYCANEYQKLLSKNRKKSSMTQNSGLYENAVVGRINGIIKEGFNIDKYNKDLPIMKQIVKETIEIYNEKRPHYSNHMLTLNQMHQHNKLKMRTHNTKNICKNVFASV